MVELVLYLLMMVLFLYQRAEIVGLKEELKSRQNDTNYLIQTLGKDKTLLLEELQKIRAYFATFKDVLDSHKNAIEAFRLRLCVVEKKVRGEDWS